MRSRRRFRRPKKAFRLFLITVALGGLGAYFNEKRISEKFPAPAALADDPLLSEKRVGHILNGDQTGGGHRYGEGAPCKSEFPQNWNDDKILGTIETIAANDNLNWQRQQNGYYVAEKMEDGVKVRVVLDDKRQNIITGYPVNTPRNPCPPANDNFNR